MKAGCRLALLSPTDGYTSDMLYITLQLGDSFDLLLYLNYDNVNRMTCSSNFFTNDYYAAMDF